MNSSFHEGPAVVYGLESPQLMLVDSARFVVPLSAACGLAVALIALAIGLRLGPPTRASTEPMIRSARLLTWCFLFFGSFFVAWSFSDSYLIQSVFAVLAAGGLSFLAALGPSRLEGAGDR